MMRKRKLIKVVAVFLALHTLFYTFLPTISYALTSGPTAPEFSSFEPVDTTDMVNLLTGDFTYNIPLLEVPGPAGGYPLALSYHSGIKTNQESSWVGLGWTLNAGAIDRSVNGVFDDASGAKSQTKDYWDGGEARTKSYSLGISIPNTGVSFGGGMSTTRDSYSGFSRNYYTGLSINPGTVAARINPSMANNPVGNIASGTSVSISSNGKKTRVSLGGGAAAGSQSAGGSLKSFTTTTLEGTIPIPYGSFDIKKFYTRYWSDETTDLVNYGSLYTQKGNSKIEKDEWNTDDNYITSYSFDTYNMYDYTSSDIKEENDPNKQLGGTFLNYDTYNVLGQGISGGIQPYVAENGDLYGQSMYLRDPIDGGFDGLFPLLGYKSLKKEFNRSKVDFRFVNDYSNGIEIDPSAIERNRDDFSTSEHSINPVDPSGIDLSAGKQHIAGSRHIEWFTNKEIVTGEAHKKGFVDYSYGKNARKISYKVYSNYLQPEAGLPYSINVHKDDYRATHGTGYGSFVEDFYRENDVYGDCRYYPYYKPLKPTYYDLSSKIGGFMITNESGVTYHYSLPVYSYNEYTRQKLKDPKKGVATFREYKNDEPYAYTWLLTAITGPDYVDRGGTNGEPDGQLDDDDWGYWVKFDYGLWTDSYQWRTPHSGYATDIENQYETFSYGVKELYYLDAIETKTHVALFEKSIRKDGKGVTSRLEGGSKPRYYSMSFKGSDCTGAEEIGHADYYVSPVSTMKLDNIYLLKKEDYKRLNIDKTAGDKYSEATIEDPYLYPYVGETINVPASDKHIKEGEDFIEVRYHNGDNVLDDDDLRAVKEMKNGLTESSLEIIRFNTDYSLAKGTPNSVGYLSDFQECSTPNDVEFPTNYDCLIPFVGGTSVCDRPQDRFDFYGKRPFREDSPCGGGIIIGGGEASEGSGFNYFGSGLNYDHLGKLTLKSVEFLGKKGKNVMPPTQFTYANNPKYNAQKYDEWGYYKSDYNSQVEGYTRRATPESAENISAWSLTEVTNPLGSSLKIAYESDDYSKAVLSDHLALGIKDMVPLSDNDVKISFKKKGLDLDQYFQVGSSCDLKTLLINRTIIINNSGPHIDNKVGKKIWDKALQSIKSVGADYITVTNQELHQSLTAETEMIQGLKILHVPYFISGFILIPQTGVHRYGGGVRVKSVTIDGGTRSNTVEYSYNNSDGPSSGTTSFAPYLLTSVVYPQEEEFFENIYKNADEVNEKVLEEAKSEFNAIISKPFGKAIGLVNEVPAPGILYETVQVTSSVGEDEYPSREVYHFRVFNESMVQREVADLANRGQSMQRQLDLKNFTSSVGSLLWKEVRDTNGDLLHETTYNYLYDDTEKNFEAALKETKQGVIEESAHKWIELHKYYQGSTEYPFDFHEDYHAEKALVSHRENYADVMTGISEHDYKTGVISSTEDLAYDFYSGVATKTLTSDSYGSSYMSETVPAYHYYPDMGLGIDGGKNMLTQEAASYSYKVSDPETLEKEGLLSASVQTWSNVISVLDGDASQQQIWRKHANFTWNGQSELNKDGTYPVDDFENKAFNFSAQGQNPDWEKTAEVTLYDVNSHALEATDINGNYAATRMDPQHFKVTATVANGAYNEMAFAGAEYISANDDPEGGVDRGDGYASTARSHTGKYSLQVPFNSKGFNFSLDGSQADLGKKYRASVWVYLPGESETAAEMEKVQLYYKIGNQEIAVHPELNKNKAKSWHLLNLDIDPGQASEVYIGCRNNSARSVYFDDFRVHPLAAAMTSYVYDPFSDELTYILDANNLYTRYEYDAMGRLIRTRREMLNFDYGPGKESFKADQITGETIYNFKRN